MSEFSQSYHLLTDDQAAGQRLLERAGLAGWVLPSGGGWTTLVVREHFTGTADPTLVSANDDLLLFYVNAEDHGWSFDLFDEQNLVAAYACEWNDEVEVDDSKLNLGMIIELMQSRGIDVEAGAVQPLLAPRTIDDVIFDDLANPGHRFAKAIGLTWYEWLDAKFFEQSGDDLPAGVITVA